MRTTNKPGATPVQIQQTDVWAVQLAQCRHEEHTALKAQPAPSAPMPVTDLWAMFDEARDQANAALEHGGLPERIALCETENERRYCVAGPEGTQRYVAISPVLLTVQGRIASGAYIGTSRTRSCIYLTPSVAGQSGWMVAPSGKVFGADQVHDLFLSEFGDDPGATSRLSPISGDDLFETPWM